MLQISPQREALDVCNELCPKMNVYGHELCLLESVLGGVLIRPLHHSERVLDTVLRWGYWDDTDCKDNCLILVINTILQDIAPIVSSTLSSRSLNCSFRAFMAVFSILFTHPHQQDPRVHYMPRKTSHIRPLHNPPYEPPMVSLYNQFLH